MDDPRSEMRAAGIPSLLLGVDGLRGSAGRKDIEAEKVAVFCTHVPDQGDWLNCLAKHYGQTTLLGLVNRMSYQEPIELLSMYTCLYMKERHLMYSQNVLGMRHPHLTHWGHLCCSARPLALQPP